MRGTRVDNTTFSLDSNNPAASYTASERVVVVLVALILLSVNVNVLWPVLNFNAELLGTIKNPEIEPEASVTKSTLVDKLSGHAVWPLNVCPEVYCGFAAVNVLNSKNSSVLVA